MNCKPGDLAIQVGGIPKYIGTIRRVIRAYDGALAIFGPAWWTEGREGWVHTLDAHLKPIRDPGEDAKDESLEWLPVPSRTKESA